MEGRAPHGLFSGKLQVDDLQLFRKGFHFIRLRLPYRLAQQRTNGDLQGLRQGDQQVGVRDGNSLLPFGDGLPHHVHLDGQLLLGEAFGFPKGFDVFA